MVGSVSSMSGTDANESVNSSASASVVLMSGTEFDEIVPEGEITVESALVDGATIDVVIGGGGGGVIGSSRMLTKISPM